jgi:hypothetical protein
VPSLRWSSSILCFAVLSGCSFIIQFDPETQPCDSASNCLPEYFCSDAGLCQRRDGGVSDTTDGGFVVDGGNCTARETVCGDGRDNDCDNQTDCADSDCSGISCDDRDLCTTGEVCSAGSCPRGTPVVCNTPTACQARAGTCQPATGQCVYPALPDGTSCGIVPAARCCTGACVDTLTATGSCGGCGSACAGAERCQPIEQACPGLPVNTSARCTCTVNAPCPRGQTCANGTCRPVATTQCAPGQSVADAGTCGAYCFY